MRSTVALLLALALIGPDAGAAQERTPERIVTLGGSITETVHALGFGDRIVAVDEASIYPEEVTRLPLVGYYRTLSAEGVLSLAPDLVVGSAASGPPQVIRQIRGAGVRVELIPDAKRPEDAADYVRAVAAALGAVDAGERLAVEVEREIAEARRLVADAGALPSAVFVWGRGNGVLSIAGSGTGADVMFAEAGVANAAGALDGYQPMNPEALIVSDPEVIVVPEHTAEELGGIDALLRQPGIGATRAGRARRVVTVDLLAFVGFGPRTGESLRAFVTDLTAATSRAGARAPGSSPPPSPPRVPTRAPRLRRRSSGRVEQGGAMARPRPRRSGRREGGPGPTSDRAESSELRPEPRVAPSAPVRLARLWGFLGVLFPLVQPAVVLSRKGWTNTVAAGMTPSQWIVCAAIVLAFAYGEGWRALARRWSPFIVGRLRSIDGASPLWMKLLAPAYALGLVGAGKRLLLFAWGGTFAILGAVAIVRAMPYPWRGMIDLGVACALTLGASALVVRFLRAPAPPASDAR
jgi:iron complex transport system substrate-binding protein